MIKNLYFKNSLPLLGILIGNLTVNAQCVPVSSFSENFDAYSCCNMGVVPTCWNSLFTPGGNQIISNTAPASGTSQIYQTGYGTGKISIVIMPPLTNINAGTHHFKFKAKVNSGPGLLEFGYMTDITDVNKFVVLEPITITNTSYDSTSERILTVPTTVPSDARLAIRNPGTTWAGHYWDDAVWEPISNLATQENEISSGIKVYPNPFNNTIHISDVKDVKSITITDAVGRSIKSIEKPAIILELNELQKGVYFVNLHFKNGIVKSFKSIKN